MCEGRRAEAHWSKDDGVESRLGEAAADKGEQVGGDEIADPTAGGPRVGLFFRANVAKDGILERAAQAREVIIGEGPITKPEANG